MGKCGVCASHNLGLDMTSLNVDSTASTTSHQREPSSWIKAKLSGQKKSREPHLVLLTTAKYVQIDASLMRMNIYSLQQHGWS